MLPTLLHWMEEGRRFSTATVIHTWGSSPRPVGAMMAVCEDGSVVGSVSGGCVEGAVMKACSEALETSKSSMLEFGALSDESVWEIGLSCGGRIKVWVCPEPNRSEAWLEAARKVSDNEPVVLEILTQTGDFFVREPHDLGSNSNESYEEGDRFFQILPAMERLVIVGAVHIAIPLVKFAAILGMETIVIEPRAALADPSRFDAVPDQMIQKWPHEALSSLDIGRESYCVVLTHDPKLDDPALEFLIRSGAVYVGALGSRTTQERRKTHLLSKGFSEEEISRIHGPVGLKIGAKSPEEIALSIIAEIVQVRNASR